MTAPAEVLDVDGVAALLGVCRHTVYSAVSAGKLPHRRLGKRYIFSRAAVLEWLANKPANGDQR